MENREKIIKEWINTRKEDNELTACVFYITVPKRVKLDKDETIKKIEDILDRNHVGHRYVDTLPGSWNLNRDWIETDQVDAAVEYCGVYPANWDIEDVVKLERMEYDGEIIIMVDWIKDGEHVPNH